MKKKYNALVIGCGNIGAAIGNYNKAVQPATHAGAFQANPKTNLVSLVEKDKKRLNEAGKYFPKAKLYTDIDKALKENKVDIVSIATPSHMHYKHVLKVAKYRVPAILSEKPIAYKVKEAEEMIRVCKKNNSQLFINHMRHFDPILNKWAKKVRNNLLGQIFQGNIYYYNGLFNNGTHWLDVMRLFLGNPISVIGKYNRNTSTNPRDMNVDGTIIFKNDIKISLQTLNKNYGYFCLKIFGEKGMIDITNLGYEVHYRKKINNKNFKGFFELSEDIVKEGSTRSLMISAINHVVNFLDKKTKPISTGEDGLAILKILIALGKSAKAGGKEIKL